MMKRGRSLTWDSYPSHINPNATQEADLKQVILFAKQSRAQGLRDLFMHAKVEKIRNHAEKIEAVKGRNNYQSEHRMLLRSDLEGKLQKADELREERIKSIQAKAKEDETKREEVAIAINIRSVII